MDAARLTFRFGASTSAGLEPGEHPLGVGTAGKDGLVYVPDTAVEGAPVMVFLHGAGGTGRREMRVWLAAADRYGVVVVAPDSQGPSWDVIHGGFGPDIAFLDAALAAVADRYPVNMASMALGGVSDGASYALSVGLANGDVFPTVVAFSPGFIVSAEPVGTPRVFISHGTADPILPIDGCSRPIVAGLRGAGFDVTYREFDGGHTVPPAIADAGFATWLTPPLVP
ncbi:MAG: alpha/beta hydrolase [Acidimicrobiales bacterium]